jgi:hypothetical protein
MQFESKIKRQYWTNSLLGLIPDLIISAIITRTLGGYIGTFILVIVGLQVLYRIRSVGQETPCGTFDRLPNGERVSRTGDL